MRNLVNALIALSITDGPQTVIRIDNENTLIEFNPLLNKPWVFTKIISISGVGVHPVVETFETLEEVLDNISVDEMFVVSSIPLGQLFELTVYAEGEEKLAFIHSRVVDVENIKIVRGEVLHSFSVVSEDKD